ncbi:hypothetical protein A2962_05355 [Candidatus Woesebacteria bacterium RIFCSPLOWO2_01_FULL_39_61]|uniref:Uncharacterized protein n=1 Tax=Candidatus Woesebacteria bacterium RIFCSPHIGHO2_02_FULL_39_13 TaxID=1802505 RepID=A0A1F7Z2Y0_9BACT|nr:MAG: hypothetical protein A2692_05700 [Candidatus Woesebacteria bacterium RIFCSPHIGHO2_01_FULL_39_95]OGM33897.1 MAG: hypothetical protein A3D01_05750 [Candidatus Woesebacteria bacterium RIFCSPHIGHO2_02_FULL_39_13]OGM37186.1 MAG: hypothetical protein A3E13_03080 [Candidatus Woesebacteria bacterium RIFCSPHIGHO2_12_FULL_40_20]OGM68308.1 MAG: hypothetical protein A2962_05355 [Candidatus Woesebacteria bacterium RIFCSPLOWO2_01_FULL_39_61]OGM74054.1 MAG: hypothetical protein A3H19_02395 [Candidatus
MSKTLISGLLVASFILTYTNSVSASILVIDSEGEITWNVLSFDSSNLSIPQSSSIEVKGLAKGKTDANSVVSLEKDSGGKISLTVASDNGERKLDVSDVKEELIELEERPSVQKMTIGVYENSFSLVQKGIKALTEFPLSVNPKTAKIVLETPTGEKYLSILPYEAAEMTLRTKWLNKIIGSQVKIIEENRELQYQVFGERVFNLLNIYEYSVPVEVRLSTSTGEVLSVKAPIWYKVVGFLLT